MSQPDRWTTRPLADFFFGGLAIIAIVTAIGSVVVALVERDLAAGALFIAVMGVLVALSLVMRASLLVFFGVISAPIFALLSFVAQHLRRRKARRDAEEWLRRPPHEPT